MTQVLIAFGAVLREARGLSMRPRRLFVPPVLAILTALVLLSFPAAKLWPPAHLGVALLAAGVAFCAGLLAG